MPTDAVSDVFLKCISTVKDASLKERLLNCEGEIVNASTEFAAKAAKHCVHTIIPSCSIGGTVSIVEMTAIYNERMARRGSPGRPIYDKLITAPKYGRCPLCGQRVVSTLDHYLAKSKFPALAVTPANLIPACFECNKVKLSKTPTCKEDEALHPYFDDIEEDEWLQATIIESTPPSIVFDVTRPIGWDGVLLSRVQHHFRLLNLNRLYASNAADELLNIKHTLRGLFGLGGVQLVRAHLLDWADSRQSANINSWQTAFYRCLANSEWYCKGGFDF